MSRLNIVLLVALIGCALSVVHTAYQQRRLFIALERARAQQQQLQQEGAQLYYQQIALSNTARFDRLATNRLKMLPVTNVETKYVGVTKRSNAAQAAEE